MDGKEFKSKKLSMTNTKKELLDSYNAAVKMLAEKDQVSLNPKRIVEEKRKNEVIDKVKDVSVEIVTKTIDTLKSESSKLLNELQEKLTAHVGKLDNIQKAILEKEKELNEIFEIEKSAYTLSALIESQNLKKEEFEAEMAEKKNTLLKEIEEKSKEWEKEKSDYEKEIVELKKEEEKKRKREEVEYEYNFNREKQLAKNKLGDELKSLEKQTKEKLDAMKVDLDKRQKEIVDKENEFTHLKEKVETFEEELKASVEKASKEISTKLELEYKNKEELLREEFKGEENVLKTKIQGLEKLVVEQAKKINELTSKLDAAYQKVQDVAVKAIEGAANLKSFNELQKILSDKVTSKGSNYES